MKCHLREYKFEEGHIAGGHFIGRIRGKNIFHCYPINADIKHYSYI